MPLCGPGAASRRGVARSATCAARALGFLVTWLAALRSGCLLLLPPSGGHADLIAMLESAADPSSSSTMPGCCSRIGPSMRAACVHSPRAQSSRAVRRGAGVEPGPGTRHCVRLYTSGSTGAPRAAAQDPGPARPRRAGACGSPGRGSRGRLGGTATASFAACRRSTCSASKPRSCCRWSAAFRCLTAVRCCPPTSRPPSSAARTAQPGSRRPCTCARWSSPARRCPHCRARASPRPCRLLRRWPRRPRRWLARRWSRSTARRKPAWSPCGARARDPRWRPVDGVRLESER